MYSLNYYLSQTPVVRRLYKWNAKKKMAHHQKIEDEKKAQDAKNLRHFERKVFSQNGEDGIIEEIFNRIGTTNKFFVEFGIENGTECNGRYLIEKCGWSGFWIDGGKDNVAFASEKFKDYPIELKQAFITRENIVSLFEEANIKKDLDLLSVDIDGNDYWVLKELLHYQPRVIVLEYNAKYLPHQSWVMPYNSKHLYDGSAHFGASLKSYTDLIVPAGYELVGCDSLGINAFYVRQDALNHKFSHAGEGVDYHYCCPKYRSHFFGHPSGKGLWF